MNNGKNKKTALQTELESILDSAKAQNIAFSDTFFYDGNFSDTLIDCSNCAFPNGSIAVFYTVQSFEKYLEKINDIFKPLSIKVKNFVVESEKLCLENINKYFSIADEVRAIFVTDKSLIDICTYLASVYNLKLVILYNNINYVNLLNNRVLFYGETVDYVEVNVERHILIDLNEIINSDDERKYVYSNIISKIISIIDYKINCIINGKQLNEFVNSLLIEAITDTYKTMKQPLYGQYLLLCKNFIKSELANLFIKGDLFDFSSIKNANFLCEKVESKNEIYFLKVYIKLLSILVSENNGLMFSPDYNLINEQLKNKTYAHELDVLKTLNEQNEKFKENKFVLLESLNSESHNIKDLLKNIDIIEKTYVLLGGEKIPLVNMKDKNLLFALTHAGDLPYCFNLATFLREVGVFEFVK